MLALEWQSYMHIIYKQLLGWVHIQIFFTGRGSMIRKFRDWPWVGKCCIWVMGTWEFSEIKSKNKKVWGHCCKAFCNRAKDGVCRAMSPWLVAGWETAAFLCSQASGQIHPPADPSLWSPLYRLRILSRWCHGDPAVFWIGPWLIPGKFQGLWL